MSSLLLIVLSAVGLILGVLLCFRGRWFLAWLRGTAGLLLIAAAVLLFFFGMDMRYYQVLTAEQPVARLAVTRLDDQSWEVLVQEGDRRLRAEIRGDEWQIDARVLRWPASWQALGFKPRYRLERISGRYTDIEDELREPRSAMDLSRHFAGFDVWDQFGGYAEALGWLDAAYGSSAYHPLEDGAVYEVSLTNSGLISRPVNAAAEDVITEWMRATGPAQEE